MMASGHWGRGYSESFWANTGSTPLGSAGEVSESHHSTPPMDLLISELDITFFSLKSIRNVSVFLIPEHAACFLLSIMPSLLSLLGKFLCILGGKAQTSALCQSFPACPD